MSNQRSTKAYSTRYLQALRTDPQTSFWLRARLFELENNERDAVDMMHDCDLLARAARYNAARYNTANATSPDAGPRDCQPPPMPEYGERRIAGVYVEGLLPMLNRKFWEWRIRRHRARRAAEVQARYSDD